VLLRRPAAFITCVYSLSCQVFDRGDIN
jgi:hypothetical protein